MMGLREQLEKDGSWLFRWRSYAPLMLFVPLLIEMQHFDWPMHSHELQQEWELFCIAVSFSGLVVRALIVGHAPARTSGRNTKAQIADSLNTTGMYSIVRHPLYLGNYLMWLGFAMFCMSWHLLAIFTLAFWLYYERIMFAEEAFLRQKFQREFEAWAVKTPAFIPRLTQWVSPSLPFSLRTVLLREYHGLFGMIVVFFALDLIGDWHVRKQLAFELPHTVLFIAGGVLYVSLRTLKKRTTLLHVAGR